MREGSASRALPFGELINGPIGPPIAEETTVIALSIGLGLNWN